MARNIPDSLEGAAILFQGPEILGTSGVVIVYHLWQLLLRKLFKLGHFHDLGGRHGELLKAREVQTSTPLKLQINPCRPQSTPEAHSSPRNACCES